MPAGTLIRGKQHLVNRGVQPWKQGSVPRSLRPPQSRVSEEGHREGQGWPSRTKPMSCPALRLPELRLLGVTIQDGNNIPHRYSLHKTMNAERGGGGRRARGFRPRVQRAPTFRFLSFKQGWLTGADSASTPFTHNAPYAHNRQIYGAKKNALAPKSSAPPTPAAPRYSHFCPACARPPGECCWTHVPSTLSRGPSVCCLARGGRHF